MTGFTNREKLLSKMRNGEHLDWDIIVIGGGITGAGILREARRQGYKALLLEQQDFSCLLYTSPSPRDGLLSRMPSSA